MSKIGGLFTGKTVENATDNLLDKDNGLLTQVGGWIGNMNFTEEERAELYQNLSQGVSEFVTSTLSENTERSKARRDIAILWIKVELGIVLMACFCAPINMELAKFYLELAFSTTMTSATMAILAFFFGPYMFGAHLSKGKKEE